MPNENGQVVVEPDVADIITNLQRQLEISYYLQGELLTRNHILQTQLNEMSRHLHATQSLDDTDEGSGNGDS